MARLSGIVFLITLVLPYARAPLCQAGAHEHGEGRFVHHEAHTLSGPHSGDGCHALMGCQIGADFEPGILAHPADLTGGATPESTSQRQTPPDIRLTPESPPPRAI